MATKAFNKPATILDSTELKPATSRRKGLTLQLLLRLEPI